MIFLMIDFARAEAHVRYNGPEEPVRAELPPGFSGTKRVPLSAVLRLDAAVLDERRIGRLR